MASKNLFDINNASAFDMMRVLPGVGQKRAAALINLKEQWGKITLPMFTSVFGGKMPSNEVLAMIDFGEDVQWTSPPKMAAKPQPVGQGQPSYTSPLLPAPQPSKSTTPIPHQVPLLPTPGTKIPDIASFKEMDAVWTPFNIKPMDVSTQPRLLVFEDSYPDIPNHPVVSNPDVPSVVKGEGIQYMRQHVTSPAPFQFPDFDDVVNARCNTLDFSDSNTSQCMSSSSHSRKSRHDHDRGDTVSHSERRDKLVEPRHQPRLKTRKDTHRRHPRSPDYSDSTSRSSSDHYRSRHYRHRSSSRSDTENGSRSPSPVKYGRSRRHGTKISRRRSRSSTPTNRYTRSPVHGRHRRSPSRAKSGRMTRHHGHRNSSSSSSRSPYRHHKSGRHSTPRRHGRHHKDRSSRGQSKFYFDSSNSESEYSEDEHQYSTKRGNPRELPKHLRYDGQTNWLSFKQKFNSHRAVLNWSEGESRDYLSWALEGKALDFYTMTTKIGSSFSFREIMRKLEARFGAKELTETARAKFQQTTQRHEETLDDWADRVLTLATPAFQHLPERHTRSEAIAKFCQGCVDKEAGKHVCLDRPRSMEEALNKMKQFQYVSQAVDGKKKKGRDEAAVNAVKSSDVNIEDMTEKEVSKLAAKLEKTSLQDSLDPRTSEVYATSVRCQDT